MLTRCAGAATAVGDHASGGDGSPIAVDWLPHSELTPVRWKLIDELVALAGDALAGLAALKLSERQPAELERNADLWTAPTLPAVQRYTGVLYAVRGHLSSSTQPCRTPIADSGLRTRPRLPAIGSNPPMIERAVRTCLYEEPAARYGG